MKGIEMDSNINLSEQEWEYIIDALNYYNENCIKTTIKTVENLRFQNVSAFFKDGEFFENYKNQQINVLKNNMKDLENICEKIEKYMEE